MGEVTMLSRMIAAGLVCTFQCHGDIVRSLSLTVRIGGRAKDHLYIVPHELGASKLITLAWRDWQSYAEGACIHA